MKYILVFIYIYGEDIFKCLQVQDGDGNSTNDSKSAVCSRSSTMGGLNNRCGGLSNRGLLLRVKYFIHDLYGLILFCGKTPLFSADNTGHTLVWNGSATIGLVSAALSFDGRSQIKTLDERRELNSNHVWADVRSGTGILAFKYSFTGRNEIGQSITLRILLALLIEGPIEIRLKVLGLVNIILKTNREASGVCVSGNKLVEVELISSSKGETAVVLITITLSGSRPSQPLVTARSIRAVMILRTTVERMST